MEEEKGGVSNTPESSNNVNPPITEKKNWKPKPKQHKLRIDYSKMDLRERSIYELKNNLYQCVICLETIKIKDAVWSCNICYHLIHMKCMKVWSNMRSSVRCPNCNTIQTSDYIGRCFCKKISNPSYNHYIPHSCGNSCDKLLKCGHYCSRQCHPGPCIPCIHIGNYCYCGKKYMNSQCGKQESCGDPCGKILCDLGHECKLICHPGNCPPCLKKIMSICYCGKSQREIQCCKRKPVLCNRKENYIEKVHEIDTYSQQPIILDEKYPIDLQIEVKNDNQTITYKTDPSLYLDPINKSFLYETLPEQYTGSFCCNEPCNTLLNCGIHKCLEVCHTGECKQCSLIKTCGCGKRTLSELLLLQSTLPCSSTPPSCGQRCLKLLNCNIHRCQDICHAGPCKKCNEKVVIICRCGQETKTITCGEKNNDNNNDNNNEYLCNNKCGMLLKCGHHKCDTICCPYRGISKKKLASSAAHCCNDVCGRLLNCNKHRCDLPCHSGKCPDCAIAITDVILKCNCGRTVIKPPYKCGTTVNCYFPCNRVRECGHKSEDHLCHDGECPPCMELVNKMCVGGHVVVPNLRCTNKCNKPLPCGHTCQLQCHAGECYNINDKNYKCKQLCNKVRKLCGHPCNEPCHWNNNGNNDNNCPNTLCHFKVKLLCKCGRRSEEVDCLMNNDETEENLAMKDRNIECDDLCLMIQRSKAFAEAFGIDVKSKVNHTVKDTNSSDIYEELLKRTKFRKSLVAWGYNNNDELLDLEHEIDIFISSPIQMKRINIPDSLKKSDKEMEELISCYNLKFEKVGNIITLTKKTDSKPGYPHPLLSETINKIHMVGDGYFPHLNEPKYEKNDPEIRTILHLYNISTYRPIPSIITPYIPEDVKIKKINHENTLLYCYSQGVASRVYDILSELEPKQFKIRYWGKVNGEDLNNNVSEEEEEDDDDD